MPDLYRIITKSEELAVRLVKGSQDEIRTDECSVYRASSDIQML